LSGETLQKTEQRIGLSTSLIILLMLSTFLFSNGGLLRFSSVEASTDIEILSYKGFLTSLGTYRVVGEVKNVGNETYRIFLNVTLYDSHSNVITSKEVQTELSAVGPNRKSPFALQLTDKNQSSNVSRCEVTLSRYEQTQPKEGKLQLQYALGYSGIAGEISNQGNSTANKVVLFATFYDEDGNVVEIASSEVIFSIDSYSSEVFSIFYPSPDISNKKIFSRARWYSLTAESMEYAINAETGLIAFLFPPEPYARFVISPISNVTTGQTITYNASTSYDLDGNVTSYRWDFGDAKVVTTPNSVTTHSYSTNGTFTITLVVFDNDGLNSTATGSITIYPSTNYGLGVYLVLLLSAICIAILGTSLLMKRRKHKLRRRDLKHSIKSQRAIHITKTSQFMLARKN
jgi:hypothetical protein